MTARHAAIAPNYEEPLELSAPPEDEADRLLRDWGTRCALRQAQSRLDYWQSVVTRLSAQPTEISWADLTCRKSRLRQVGRA
ncbi:MAG: hypothetical protein AAF414_13675 [Pseudomonadota bacterium]